MNVTRTAIHIVVDLTGNWLNPYSIPGYELYLKSRDLSAQSGMALVKSWPELRSGLMYNSDLDQVESTHHLTQNQADYRPFLRWTNHLQDVVTGLNLTDLSLGR